MPKDIFANQITRERFMSEKNSEVRGGMYAILGQKGVMDLLGAEVIDVKVIAHANGDLETVELLKTKEKFPEIENQPFAWVKMVCPSTGTNYLQGVEPHHTNALEAIASLSMFSPKDYSFDFRS
jgi:cobyric acid synthase